MKHLVTFLLLTVVAGQQASSHWDQYSGVEDWDHFKQVYKKQYSDVEEELGRKQIFEAEVSYVVRHNVLYEQGGVTFKVGVNNFSDWTRAELESRYLMTDYLDDEREVSDELEAFDEADVSDTLSRSRSLPSSHDWRDAGIVTGIKNQGGCGSCWAFAAVGAIEAAWAKNTGSLYSLSEQELIDCGVGDCGGGWSYKGFETVIDMGGVMGEDAYPYTGTDQGHCQYQDELSMARISSYKHVPSLNEHTMAKDLFSHSPIAVSIDASLHSFHAYTSGIYYDPDCSTSKTNHIVLIVGYNMEAQNEDKHYWIVKNSWGTGWGMDGYIHMKMWVNNCNIARWGYFPKV